MAVNRIVETRKLGKYAGTCPDCNLMRGTEEQKGSCCGRCGHKHKTKAVHRDLDGNIKEGVDNEKAVE